ncbi:hypothetical protein FF38_09415 [Lucilia cuprina]|uniref:Uncharacterized protein n=1 Tax=Lucilia cuprina TaxID=7375 RepID=A0A0L0C8G7_LUCCU|nr:hypothetical protein FF38_09415 [Lucilia cuprina]
MNSLQWKNMNLSIRAGRQLHPIIHPESRTFNTNVNTSFPMFSVTVTPLFPPGASYLDETSTLVLLQSRGTEHQTHPEMETPLCINLLTATHTSLEFSFKPQPLLQSHVISNQVISGEYNDITSPSRLEVLVASFFHRDCSNNKMGSFIKHDDIKRKCLLLKMLTKKV